eukprot:14969420-Alexandrium_andersonii.AAC.1
MAPPNGPNSGWLIRGVPHAAGDSWAVEVAPGEGGHGAEHGGIVIKITRHIRVVPAANTRWARDKPCGNWVRPAQPEGEGRQGPEVEG